MTSIFHLDLIASLVRRLLACCSGGGALRSTGGGEKGVAGVDGVEGPDFTEGELPPGGGRSINGLKFKPAWMAGMTMEGEDENVMTPGGVVEKMMMVILFTKNAC